METTEDCWIPFTDSLEHGRLIDDPYKKVEIKRYTKFVILKDVLYRWSLDGILLRCKANHGKRQAMSVCT